MALVHITGVLEDGTKRGATVPTDVRQVLRITKTVDYTIRLTIVTSAGVASSATGHTFALSIRKTPESGALTISPALSGTAATTLGPNVVDFTITDVNTRNLTPGVYTYDVVRTTGSGLRDVVVPLSALYLSSTPGRY